jgi:hypothetical protein
MTTFHQLIPCLVPIGKIAIADETRHVGKEIMLVLRLRLKSVTLWPRSSAYFLDLIRTG